MIACLNLTPWPLVLLRRQHPGVPVAVLGEGRLRKVLYASPDAVSGGVQTNMRDLAAISRVPDLHAEVIAAPVQQATWNELLEDLYARYSDRIDGKTPGLAYLKVSAQTARELAAALHAPVGVADSMELAYLASLLARPGEIRDIQAGPAEKTFLQLTPIEGLSVAGLTPVHAERLRFLGVRGIADLWNWSAAQREAFLGVDVGKRVNRFLKGERTTALPRYTPGQFIEAHLDFDQPLLEPAETESALKELLPEAVTALRGRTAAYVALHADTVGGRLTATRKLKWPLDGKALHRIACLALEDTQALPLGIDRLTVQFSGLQHPARMVGLWAGIAELEVTKDVLDRFPDALVRVRWLDPWAYATDQQYQWVDWLTGDVRLTAMTPTRSSPLTPMKRRDAAAERMLAFFEQTARREEQA